MTDLIIGIGKFFTWTFQILPIIGKSLNWILVLVGFLALIYWSKRIIDFGQKDKDYDGDRL